LAASVRSPAYWSERLEMENEHHLDLNGTSDDPLATRRTSYLGRSTPKIHHAKFVNWRTMKTNLTSTAQQR
jgi:hypothetical protein